MVSHKHRNPQSATTQKNSGGVRSFVIFIISLVVLGLIAAGAYAIMSHRGSIPMLGSTSATGNGTTLTIATAEPINSLDITQDTSPAVDQILLHNVYETLVGRDEKNQPQATGVAEKWDVSSDGLTYTFSVPSAARFSTGRSLTAADVVASLQYTIQNQLPDASYLSKITNVQSHDNRVIISLSQADPNVLWALSTRAGIIYDTQSTYDKATEAIGAGAYTVSAFEPGTSLTLKANAQYWKDNTQGSSTIVVQATPDAHTAVSNLENGQVDALIPLSNAPSTADAAQARTDLSNLSNVTVSTTASTHRWAIALNTSADSLFSDTHIRQAYRAMLDKSALITTLGVSATPISGPVASTDPGFEDYNALYPFDVQQARSLLSFFGYSRNFTLAYKASDGDAFAQNVADQLAALGGTITPQSVADDQWQSQIVEGKNFDMAIIDIRSSHDIEDLSSADFLTQYTDSSIESLRKAVSTATTSDDYANAVKQLAAHLAEQTPIMWAYEEQPVVAAREGISGLPTAMADSYLNLAGITKQKN
ncbi:ABC transporter substrate-binding protein [Alloscardovia criceti]|uniref:ABC transporter substrate-binding protein n=1 Tax=Alloscardovia criceti TaxID=356828 RepID=UPI000372682C|nr:ABC transporter substrate-binding protein [Alloscardovia criceti]